ncbi:hypothetical protein [uncultured Helicobacter sp.]
MIDGKHRISHLDSVYAREAERSGDSLPTSGNKFLLWQKLALK